MTRLRAFISVLLLLTLWRGAVLPMHLAEHSLEHLAQACDQEPFSAHLHEAAAPTASCPLCHVALQPLLAAPAEQSLPAILTLASPLRSPATALFRTSPDQNLSRGPPAA